MIAQEGILNVHSSSGEGDRGGRPRFAHHHQTSSTNTRLSHAISRGNIQHNCIAFVLISHRGDLSRSQLEGTDCNQSVTHKSFQSVLCVQFSYSSRPEVIL